MRRTNHSQISGSTLSVANCLMSSETLLAEILVGQGRARHADHGEFPRQQVVFRQIVERGNQLAAGQVAAGAKNHHGAGIAGLADPLLLHCRHDFSLGHIYFLIVPGST